MTPFDGDAFLISAISAKPRRGVERGAEAARAGLGGGRTVEIGDRPGRLAPGDLGAGGVADAGE